MVRREPNFNDLSLVYARIENHEKKKQILVRNACTLYITNLYLAYDILCSQIEYACNLGYEYVSGNVLRMCLEGNQWTGTPLMCQRKCSYLIIQTVYLLLEITNPEKKNWSSRTKVI